MPERRGPRNRSIPIRGLTALFAGVVLGAVLVYAQEPRQRPEEPAGGPPRTGEQAPAPDGQAAVDPKLAERVAANMQASMKRLGRYCWRQQIVEEKITSSGGVSDSEERLEYVCHVDRVPIYKQLTINGKPTGQKAGDPWPEITDDANWRQQVQRAAQRHERYHQLIGQVPSAFNFAHVGEEMIEDRPVDIYHLTPKPGYRPVSRATEMLKHVEARAWVDRQAASVVRLEAAVLRDFNMWGGLALKVYKGGRYEIRQRPAGGVWLPYFAEERYRARVALFKHIGYHQRVERSEFMPSQLRSKKVTKARTD